MKICFLVRSIHHQLPNYTTTHLAFEAYRRGHKVVYSTVNSLTYTNDQHIRAVGIQSPVQGLETRAAFIHSLQSDHAVREEISLSRFDAVFLRYNPHEGERERDGSKNPVLEFGRLLKQQGVLVLNDPAGLSRAASKMYLCTLPPEIRARTLITRSTHKIKDFLRELRKPAIIKPLSGFGGQDVFFIKNTRDININQIISAVSKSGYVMAQEYIPAVTKGDKRLLLLNGAPIFVDGKPAIYRRVSPKGEIRSNIHIGGTRKTAEFTKTEERIAEAIQTKLVSDGLYFVVADIVGDKLLEINVFCPGGINNINELYQINVGSYVVEDLEKRVRLWKTHAPFSSPTSLVRAL